MYEKATRDTMYFIGVTTGKSSIMKVFPKWMEAMGVDLAIKGIDLPIHASPEAYLEAVRFIKRDRHSKGALVTTHKIDLYEAAKDLFEYLDPYASAFSEMSSISKSGDGRELRGHAKDPISCGMAMEEFIPLNYWKVHPRAGVMIMGAGGSAISMCSYFLRPDFEGNRPAKVVVCNRSQPRLDSLREICEKLGTVGVEFEYRLTPESGDNDKVLESMPDSSLIVNATGLGKDRPGSPISDSARFPKGSLVWEINYRGGLDFLHQAKRQEKGRGLLVEDGWMYFIYGWTQVIAEVIHREIRGDLLYKLSEIASAV
jgi:shikimate dehydrogenase